MRNRLPRHAAMLAVLLGAGLVACGDDDSAGNAERFCGEIEVNQEMLFGPDITSSTDIEVLLDLYREIGRFAPLSIEEEWDQLVLNYETASTVVPGDDASIQAAAAQAYQSEASAARVSQWLVDNCALDIGPVETIVAQDG